MRTLSYEVNPIKDLYKELGIKKDMKVIPLSDTEIDFENTDKNYAHIVYDLKWEEHKGRKIPVSTVTDIEYFENNGKFYFLCYTGRMISDDEGYCDIIKVVEADHNIFKDLESNQRIASISYS